MLPHADENWWNFTIDPNKRTDQAVIQGVGQVNPQTPEGRRLLDYHRYIGLDHLLDCQVPSSRIPDERIFIITHQLFELVFKQMIFDFGVIAETFKVLLLKDSASFLRLCKSENPKALPDASEEFWRPALHASGRLAYSSNEILPALLKYLDRTTTDDQSKLSLELFNSDEFKAFRGNLIPASGFQTAQLRLIGRALGKSNLFKVKVFPSQTFQRFYLGPGEGDGLPLSLADPLILRNGNLIGNPPENSPCVPVAELDKVAHDVLARLSPSKPGEDRALEESLALKKDPGTMEKLRESYRVMFLKVLALEKVERELREDLAIKNAKQFEQTWVAAVDFENERRRAMSGARKGADVCGKVPHSFLCKILDRIVETDRAMYGYTDEKNQAEHGGFLSKHKVTALSQMQGSGTSGGGVPYLNFSIDKLFHNFPALVHYAHRVPIKPKQKAQVLTRVKSYINAAFLRCLNRFQNRVDNQS